MSMDKKDLQKTMEKCVLGRCEPILAALAAFLFFCLFFYSIHPLVLFDTDDWLYSHAQRNVALQWKGWNPARILPETLMPIVTLIGTSCLNFFIQDYFSAISLSYAIALSLSIAIMVYLLYRLLRKSNARLILLLYFLVCHFWIYRTADNGNNYMFRTVDSSCVFYYVIPNLLNCILVLWIMQMQMSGETISKGFLEMPYSKKGAFLFFCFFGIYSNLWASILLAVYTSVAALFDAIRLFAKKQFALAGYLKTHMVEVFILLLWGGSKCSKLMAAAQSVWIPAHMGLVFWQRCRYAWNHFAQ